MRTKKVAIVAPHFTPSNLTSVHRARLWSLYLERYGWEPIIVTVHWRFYEEELDWDLHNSVPKDLRVIRTKALATKPIRIVGDIGLRGFPWLYKTLCDLARNQEIDFVHITIPSNYASLLGRLVYRRYRVPYGLDYIDPWVHEWPAAKIILSKAWWSLKLAKLLEPWAIRYASLITGVAESYYSDALKRNSHTRQHAVSTSMPYGIAQSDFEDALGLHQEKEIYKSHETEWNMIYAGAMLPHSFEVLEVVFRALSNVVKSRGSEFESLQLRFVGTGRGRGKREYSLKEYINKYELDGHVNEYPTWSGYLSVLRHLKMSDAILVLGSDRKHYTPSKVYQAILSGKPILAILQKDSATIDVLNKYGKSHVVVFDTVDDLDENQIAEELLTIFTAADSKQLEANQEDLLDLVSANRSAKMLANALDAALERSDAI